MTNQERVNESFKMILGEYEEYNGYVHLKNLIIRMLECSDDKTVDERFRIVISQPYLNRVKIRYLIKKIYNDGKLQGYFGINRMTEKEFISFLYVMLFPSKIENELSLTQRAYNDYFNKKILYLAKYKGYNTLKSIIMIMLNDTKDTTLECKYKKAISKDGIKLTAIESLIHILQRKNKIKELFDVEYISKKEFIMHIYLEIIGNVNEELSSTQKEFNDFFFDKLQKYAKYKGYDELKDIIIKMIDCNEKTIQLRYKKSVSKQGIQWNNIQKLIDVLEENNKMEEFLGVSHICIKQFIIAIYLKIAANEKEDLSPIQKSFNNFFYDRMKKYAKYQGYDDLMYIIIHMLNCNNGTIEKKYRDAIPKMGFRWNCIQKLISILEKENQLQSLIGYKYITAKEFVLAIYLKIIENKKNEIYFNKTTYRDFFCNQMKEYAKYKGYANLQIIINRMLSFDESKTLNEKYNEAISKEFCRDSSIQYLINKLSSSGKLQELFCVSTIKQREFITSIYNIIEI